MDSILFSEILDHLFSSFIGFVLIWFWLTYLLTWLITALIPDDKPWKEWEGSIITAIKLAEKNIPSGSSDTPSTTGLAKLDEAQRFVLQAYADANRGKQPKPHLIVQLRQAIQIKHDEMDRYGSLRRK